MNWEAIRSDLAAKLIGALAFGVIGFLAGTNQTAEMKRQIERNSERLDRWDKTATARRDFMGAASSRLEFLCNRDKECRERFDPMNVPE